MWIKKMQPLNNQRPLMKQMGIDRKNYLQRLAFMNFTDRDALLLKNLYPQILANSDTIIDALYDNIKENNAALAVINKAGSNFERLRVVQKKYLLELFGGDYGMDYFENRLAVGLIHNQIGLDLQWYLGGYSVYMQQLAPVILKFLRFRTNQQSESIQAVFKIMMLDSQLAMESYFFYQLNGMKDLSISKDNLEANIVDYGQVLSEVAKGDLSQRIEYDETDDMGDLSGHINAMIDSVANTTQEVTYTSDTILRLLGEAQFAINEQSKGAEKQAVSVTKTASFMETINAISSQTLDKALELGLSAEKISEEGKKGTLAVEQSVNAMEDIRDKMELISQTITTLSDQTKQITEITNVVSDLSHQSKMLALNASIEAAKAGEAGKGFAVVAAEVKDLAEQSQQSTLQVKRILQDIESATERAVKVTNEGRGGVVKGVELMHSTGDVMTNLNTVIVETSDVGRQIVDAVQKESEGINQMVQAMEDINEVTVKFIGFTEKQRKANEEISWAATNLQGLVSHFRFANEDFDLLAMADFHEKELVKMKQFLAGEITLNEDHLLSSSNCQLTQWQNATMAQYSNVPQFEELAVLHEKLHDYTHQLFNFISSGNFVRAKESFVELEILTSKLSVFIKKVHDLTQ
jgi:methyl-accepting chemotaxis protein